MKIIISILTLALAGCAAGVRIGEAPSDPAPQIVFMGAKDVDGIDYLTWRNIPSFGQVPAELQAGGDHSCMNYDLVLRAIGYHPQARGRDGAVLPGGGFYCAVRSTGGYSDDAPQLVEQNGALGWDRPSAFGAVPNDVLVLGQERCGQFGVEPLAYHPNALILERQPIQDGGFLCLLPEQTH